MSIEKPHGLARRLVEEALEADLAVANETLWFQDIENVRAAADALDAECDMFARTVAGHREWFGTGWPWHGLKIIENEAEYEVALARVEALMDAEPDTREESELFLLACLVEDWEKEHYPIATPTLWPQGDDAVQELARAMHGETHDIRTWDDLNSQGQFYWTQLAAAVLARLGERERNDE